MLNIYRDREKRMAGYTLIEVMVAVTIVAILAAVAMPAYYNHMVRSRQSSVVGELMSIRAAQEQYFANNGEYAGTINKLDKYPTSGTYRNGDYVYWVIPDTDPGGWANPTTNANIENGTIWAQGDPNHDGASNDRWALLIGELSAKPQHDDSAGSEGFSWSSMVDIFR